jgi:hypothetical protein
MGHNKFHKTRTCTEIAFLAQSKMQPASQAGRVLDAHPTSVV